MMLWWFFVPTIMILLIWGLILHIKRTSAEWHQLIYAMAAIVAFFWIIMSLTQPMREVITVYEHNQFVYTQNAGQTCILVNTGTVYTSDKAIVFTTISNPQSKVAVVQPLSEWGAEVHSPEIRIIIQ